MNCRLSDSGLFYKLCESLQLKEPCFTPRDVIQTKIQQMIFQQEIKKICSCSSTSSRISSGDMPSVVGVTVCGSLSSTVLLPHNLRTISILLLVAKITQISCLSSELISFRLISDI
uniref:Uncharacterized protein n=1 Tax=Romanomermis culicivorax TaxID=13658 RepID=A0A915HT21_ROMCU